MKAACWAQSARLWQFGGRRTYAHSKPTKASQAMYVLTVTPVTVTKDMLLMCDL